VHTSESLSLQNSRNFEDFKALWLKIHTPPPLHQRIFCNTQHQVYSLQWVHNLFVYVIMRYLFVYVIVFCIYALCILSISSFKILTISVINLNSDVMITPFSSFFFFFFFSFFKFFFFFFLKWNVHVRTLCSSVSTLYD
jgi:hypothetical protein